MVRLTKKMQLAIEAVVDIATHASSEPIPSLDITRRRGIPHRFLEQTLQQLVRAGVLNSVRGPRGGYRLARERQLLTVGDVARVVRLMEVSESPREEMAVSALGRTLIRPLWARLSDEFMARLDAISIHDLCLRADPIFYDARVVE